MTKDYRVKMYLVGFDVDRASELKEILKIYHDSKGKAFFKEVLRRVHDGERVMIYETNAAIDAHRVAQSFLRAGGQIEIDGIEEDNEPF